MRECVAVAGLVRCEDAGTFYKWRSEGVGERWAFGRSPALLRCRNTAAGCLQMREARVRRGKRAGEDLGAKWWTRTPGSFGAMNDAAAMLLSGRGSCRCLRIREA
jgi:hypothetical protein